MTEQERAEFIRQAVLAMIANGARSEDAGNFVAAAHVWADTIEEAQDGNS